MSNYTKLTNFASKDALPTGNPLKIVKGTEIDAEFNAISTAISTKLDNTALPVGIICMWSGSIASIPSGWAICDGANGTPNLRNRFIVGAGASYAVGDVGGFDSVTLTIAQMPSHFHTGTVNANGGHSHTVHDPGHVHGNGDSTVQNFIGGSNGAFVRLNSQASNPTGAAATGISINAVGNHTHDFVSAVSGSDQAHENRPPYWALAFIMKIS